jgi:hypothetical protein
MERFRPVPESVLKTSKYGRYMSVVRTPVAFGPSGITANHEAAHVVASKGKIRRATIIPRGDALGSTEPEVMTPAAAAAAAADGHSGTSWDEFLTERYLGVPFGQAKAAARAELSGKEFEKQAVASTLQKKGTIFQADVDEAYRLADKAKKGIGTVEVTLIDNSGKKTQYRSESTKSVSQIVNKLEADEKIEQIMDEFEREFEKELEPV